MTLYLLSDVGLSDELENRESSNDFKLLSDCRIVSPKGGWLPPPFGAPAAIDFEPGLLENGCHVTIRVRT